MKMEEFLSEHGIKFVHPGEHHHARPGWINLDCPFCSPRSSKYRMGFNLYGKYFNCWTCGPQRVNQTLTELTGLPFGKIKEIFDGIERDVRYQAADRRGILQFPHGLTNLLHPHREYLLSRNFDPNVLVHLWNLRGFGPVAGIYTWRIFIPNYFDNAVVSWTSRSLDPKSRQRYLSAPPNMEVFSPKKLLYGEDYCKANTIVVCEGPADVWRLGPGAVAIMGLGYSRAQLARIARYRKRVVCFDSDTAGQRRAEILCNELAPFPGETHNVVLDASDPGSAHEREVKKLWKAVCA